MKCCAKCGSVNEGDMAYCYRCGTPLEQAPATNSSPAPQAETVSQPANLNVSLVWMILNITATVLCCPGFPFTIAGIVFAALGSESFHKGDLKDMRKKSLVSMVFFIIGVVLGLVGWIGLLFAMSGRLQDFYSYY